jgi:hypothetical protein
MRLRSLVLGVLGGLLLLPSIAQGQSGLTWRLQVYAVSANPVSGSPFYTLTLPTSIVRCASTIQLPAVPTTAPVNPKSMYWTHPALRGLVCKADLSGQRTFTALPAGGPYPFSLVAITVGGEAAPTAGADPFTRVDVPVAVGILIIK